MEEGDEKIGVRVVIRKYIVVCLVRLGISVGGKGFVMVG